MRNIFKCLKFIKEVLVEKYKEVNQMELKNKTYMQYYKENISLQNKLIGFEEKFPNFRIFQILAKQLQEKNIKFNERFQHDIDRLFDDKKSNFFELFCLFSISEDKNDDEAIETFVERMKVAFKQKVKETIIQTLYNYSDSKEKYSFENIIKVKQLNKLEFNEYNFTNGFKLTILELKELCDIFLYYADVKEKYIFKIF